MTKVVVDEPLLSRLEQTAGTVEICDPSGRTRGYFRPVVNLSDYEGVECPVSEQELRRRVADGGGRPLAEILAGLEKRA